MDKLYTLWNWIENWLMRATHRVLSSKREKEIRRAQDKIMKRYYISK